MDGAVVKKNCNTRKRQPSRRHAAGAFLLGAVIWLLLLNPAVANLDALPLFR